MGSSTRKTGAGFTLIELLITLAIAGIVLGLAVPSFKTLIERNRLETGANRLFTALIQARSEALKRNLPAAVCKSADGSTCTTNGEWEQGWLVYVDENADDSLDAGEPVITASGALEGGDTLRSSAALGDYVMYRTDGTAHDLGSFVLCNKDGDLDIAREIQVSITGRPRRQKSTTNCMQ